jgi:hypothetical protein
MNSPEVVETAPVGGVFAGYANALTPHILIAVKVQTTAGNRVAKTLISNAP